MGRCLACLCLLAWTSPHRFSLGTLDISCNQAYEILYRRHCRTHGRDLSPGRGRGKAPILITRLALALIVCQRSWHEQDVTSSDHSEDPLLRPLLKGEVVPLHPHYDRRLHTQR
jgi:hypothetical protein